MSTSDPHPKNIAELKDVVAENATQLRDMRDEISQLRTELDETAAKRVTCPAKEAVEQIRQQQQMFRESMEERYRHEWMSFETRQKRFIEAKISELKDVLMTIERSQVGRHVHGKESRLSGNGDTPAAPLPCLDASPTQDTVIEGEMEGVYPRRKNSRFAQGRAASSTTRYRATVRSRSYKVPMSHILTLLHHHTQDLQWHPSTRATTAACPLLSQLPREDTLDGHCLKMQDLFGALHEEILKLKKRSSAVHRDTRKHS